jgi:hypothetical protein
MRTELARQKLTYMEKEDKRREEERKLKEEEHKQKRHRDQFEEWEKIQHII